LQEDPPLWVKARMIACGTMAPSRRRDGIYTHHVLIEELRDYDVHQFRIYQCHQNICHVKLDFFWRDHGEQGRKSHKRYQPSVLPSLVDRKQARHSSQSTRGESTHCSKGNMSPASPWRVDGRRIGRCREVRCGYKGRQRRTV
jgi:hypothetical protein